MTPDYQAQKRERARRRSVDAGDQPMGLVLVADDDDDIRTAVSEMLTFHGYRVAEARNGKQALALALRLRPAVVLLDHCMPGIAGAEVLERLSKSREKDGLVLMSAVADLRTLARSVGASHVLPKPFDVDQLIALVGALMVGAE